MSAIEVAVEFCVSIGAFEFLFTEVFDFFDERDYYDEFIEALETFIMSGQFKNYIVPQDIVRKLIFKYEDAQKYAELEDLIQKLNLS